MVIRNSNYFHESVCLLPTKILFLVTWPPHRRHVGRHLSSARHLFLSCLTSMSCVSLIPAFLLVWLLVYFFSFLGTGQWGDDNFTCCVICFLRLQLLLLEWRRSFLDSMSAMTQWTVDTSVVDPMAGIVSLTTCRMKFFHASWQHSLFVLRKTKF